MNNLELIISGNLTGFSRFFVTSGANDLLKDAKIDFDYRNFVSFMEEGDKTYAVSFAPQVIALSLISRTLDSFRRPGILVVSLLLPRNTKVESVNNPQNEKAVYQLLNAINDKFTEKNLHNGMLNQNPIVLMQDYYTDILANYRLVQDYQRGVNLTIDNSSFNKNIGYVKSSEKAIVAYLNTPCRRAYEGYHSIIISPKAPQNIDEPVEELKLYNVYVENTNQRLTNVTIDSVIQAVYPKRGEKDNNFPREVRNLTYRQVLDGQGGQYISAKITGDTIHLAYHFEKEKKQVAFKIMQGSDEIDFSRISLVVQNDDGIFYAISNNPYIFEGEEIYKAKTLKSGDDNYDFSQPLDLTRILNEGTVLVKIKPAIGQPLDNHVINTLPISMAGMVTTSVVSAHGAEKKGTSLRNDSIFSNNKPNSNKDKAKSNHDIRKVFIPLMALWLILGGIYTAWTYFDKNSEPTNKETTTSNKVDKDIDFYIVDKSGSQGERSDCLEKELRDELDEKQITFELSASIKRESVNGSWNYGTVGKDTVTYTMHVSGNAEDTLIVNLMVKYTGKSEQILETQKKILLSELNEVNHNTIQLPVAFSDLKLYDEVQYLERKKSKISKKILAIEEKSKQLYNALMTVYDKIPDETEKVEQPKTSEEIKLEDDANALEIIRKGNSVSDLNKYRWGKGHRELVDKWNAAIKNKNKEKVKNAASNVTWDKLSTAINQVNAIK